MITAFAFVLLAGLGAVVRAEVGHRLNRGLPIGTMAVNITGAFALGLLTTAASPVLTVLGTAGLGALTTFSSFVRDAVALVEERRPVASTVYVLGTIVLGIAGAGAGIALA